MCEREREERYDNLRENQEIGESEREKEKQESGENER